LCLAASLCAVLLDYGSGRDQGIYRVVAGAMARGGAPYLDAWDFKPPGIFLVFSLATATFGTGEAAVRWLEMLGLASLVPAFWILSRRALGEGRAGLLAASLSTLSYVSLGFWDTAQPEGFGGVLLAWALVFATVPEAPGRRVVLHWLAAGALYGAAALLKPSLGGGLLVSLGFVAAGRSGRGRFLAPGLSFAVGATLPVATTLLWFVTKEALGALYEALFVFAPQYTALNLAESSFFALMGQTLAPLLRFGTPQLLGLVALFALPPLAEAERRASGHVLGVAGVVLVGVGLQAKLFPYHYAAALLLLALPAGWGLWKLWLRIADRPLGWALFGLGLLALASPFHPGGRQLTLFRQHTAIRLEAARSLPPERDAIRDRLHSLADVDAATNRKVAKWIAQNTRAEDAVYIWGFAPGIYAQAGRRPASRFIYNVPQRAAWSAAASRSELIDELEASPPAVIVVASDDRFPHVTGNDQDSREALRGFPELESLLSERYTPAARPGDMEISRLKMQERRPNLR
jgi:hypothetical protein